jgi:hypothetical protein
LQETNPKNSDEAFIFLKSVHQKAISSETGDPIPLCFRELG